jgi:hypothetical protein
MNPTYLTIEENSGWKARQWNSTTFYCTCELNIAITIVTTLCSSDFHYYKKNWR